MFTPTCRPYGAERYRVLALWQAYALLFILDLLSLVD
jgi:hypothetical protein